jgi:hypothetical protein
MSDFFQVGRNYRKLLRKGKLTKLNLNLSVITPKF